MKFSAALALLVAASASTTNAFSPASSSAAPKNSRLAATVEDQKVAAGTMIPPLSPSQIWSEEGRVASLYDVNVQKTYGYVID